MRLRAIAKDDCIIVVISEGEIEKNSDERLKSVNNPLKKPVSFIAVSSFTGFRNRFIIYGIRIVINSAGIYLFCFLNLKG